MSNQPLQVPEDEQLQQFLTPTPLDLTERRFKVKSYNRDKIFRVMSEVISTNPDVVSHAFIKHGNYVDIIICNSANELHTVPFHLGSRSTYDIVLHDYVTLTFGQYMESLLTQHVWPRQIDFKQTSSVIYL
jgi:hypothetical protein